MEATIGGYGAVEKTYHLCRRRRWVRNRRLVDSTSQKKEEVNKIDVIIFFILRNDTVS